MTLKLIKNYVPLPPLSLPELLLDGWRGEFSGVSLSLGTLLEISDPDPLAPATESLILICASGFKEGKVLLISGACAPVDSFGFLEPFLGDASRSREASTDLLAGVILMLYSAAPALALDPTADPPDPDPALDSSDPLSILARLNGLLSSKIISPVSSSR